MRETWIGQREKGIRGRCVELVGVVVVGRDRFKQEEKNSKRRRERANSQTFCDSPHTRQDPSPCPDYHPGFVASSPPKNLDRIVLGRGDTDLLMDPVPSSRPQTSVLAFGSWPSGPVCI